MVAVGVVSTHHRGRGSEKLDASGEVVTRKEIAMGYLIFLIYPNMIVLYIAIFGAVFGGLPGFIGFGILGFIGMLIFTAILRKLFGGRLPRRVRDEIVTDFLAKHNNLVADVYPNDSGYDRKRKIEVLFEEMVKQFFLVQRKVSGSNDPIGSLHFSNFLPVAERVAEQLPTPQSQELASTFIEFLKHHPGWYGNTFGVAIPPDTGPSI